MDGNDDHPGDNPGIAARVGSLESDVSAIKTDIKWIKMLITPTFLVTLLSLIIMVAGRLT